MASFIAPLIGGLAGLFGGGQQQKTQTSGTVTNNQTGTFNQQGSTQSRQTQGTQLTPLQQSLINQFSSQAQNLASSAANLAPYTAQGLQQINNGSQISNQILQNNLASKGLGTSPVAATAQNQADLSRISQSNSFLQQIPLLQRQLQEQAVGGLETAYGATPKTTFGTSSGTTQQSGTTTQQGTQTQQGTNLISGNQLGGLFSGLGAGLLGPSSGADNSNLGAIIGSLFGGGSGGGYNPSTASQGGF